MAQLKKETVQQAILDSAHELFSERGYHHTTLQDIASSVGVGVSSLYTYFPSKLHLLYAVVQPWQVSAFEELEARVALLGTPREKLRATLLGVWRDIPNQNIGLANSQMEALASADPGQGKPVPLLAWVEDKLMTMLVPILDGRGFDFAVLPHLIMMAYDGFVINRRLNDLRNIERLADGICDMAFGPPESDGAAAPGGPGCFKPKI